MPDSKVTALTAATPVGTDLVYLVDDPGAVSPATPTSKKATVQSVIDLVTKAYVESLVISISEAQITNLDHYTTTDANVDIDARVTKAFVEALGIFITESQISDLKAYLTKVVAANIDSGAVGSGSILEANGTGGATWVGHVAPIHTHTESDITNLSHDAVKLRGVALDETVATPADGKILVYRSVGTDWVLEDKPVFTNPALGGLTDVTITAVADDEILSYDTATAEWINKTAAEAGVAASIHTHTESDITDLGPYLANVVEDTTPELGGELNVGVHNVIRHQGEKAVGLLADVGAVNFLQIRSRVAGSHPTLAAVGDDANVNLLLLPKGTGIVAHGVSGQRFTTVDETQLKSEKDQNSGYLGLNSAGYIANQGQISQIGTQAKNAILTHQGVSGPARWEWNPAFEMFVAPMGFQNAPSRIHGWQLHNDFADAVMRGGSVTTVVTSTATIANADAPVRSRDSGYATIAGGASGGTVEVTIAAPDVTTPANSFWTPHLCMRAGSLVSITNLKAELQGQDNLWVVTDNAAPVGKTTYLWEGTKTSLAQHPVKAVRFTLTIPANTTVYIKEYGAFNDNREPGAYWMASLNRDNVWRGQQNMNGGRIIGLGDGVGAQDAVTKIQLDGKLANVVEDLTPQLGGNLDTNGKKLVDASGNEILDLLGQAGAVNQVRIVSSPTGSGPLIQAQGDDVNVDLVLSRKGTGAIRVDTAQIKDVGDGTLAQDAVTKAQLDGHTHAGGGGGVLAYTKYAPATEVTQVSSATQSDLFGANLDTAFTVPASGAVRVELSLSVTSASSTPPLYAIGASLDDGATVAEWAGQFAGHASVDPYVHIHTWILTGLTPSAAATLAFVQDADGINITYHAHAGALWNHKAPVIVTVTELP